MAFTALPPLTFGLAAKPPADTPLVRTRAAARRTHEAKLAADLLPALPAPGETVHALMSGRYDLAQVITATVRRWPVGTHTVLLRGFFARHNKE